MTFWHRLTFLNMINSFVANSLENLGKVVALLVTLLFIEQKWPNCPQTLKISYESHKGYALMRQIYFKHSQLTEFIGPYTQYPCTD